MRLPNVPRVIRTAVIAAVITAMVATDGSVAASATGTGVKPDVGGVVAQFGPGGETRPAVTSFIVSVSWADLQPDRLAATESGQQLTGRDMNAAALPQIAAGNPIDRAVAAVRRSGGRWSGVKVRLYAGAKSPRWVLHDFGSVALHTFVGGRTVNVPRFWNWSSPVGRRQAYAFGDAFARLHRALAASYDGTTGNAAVVREVTVAGCMTEFAEPMVRNRADRAVLLAAGYSSTGDEVCQYGQVDAAAAAWQHTTVSLAVNPYTDLDAGGSSITLAEGFAQHCRDVLHARCLLQNNELCRDSPDDSKSKLMRLYDWLASLNAPTSPIAGRGPIAFQTDAPSGGVAAWDPAYSPPTHESFLRCVEDAGLRWAPSSLEIRSRSYPEDPATTSDADIAMLQSDYVHARSF